MDRVGVKTDAVTNTRETKDHHGLLPCSAENSVYTVIIAWTLWWHHCFGKVRGSDMGEGREESQVFRLSDRREWASHEMDEEYTTELKLMEEDVPKKSFKNGRGRGDVTGTSGFQYAVILTCLKLQKHILELIQTPLYPTCVRMAPTLLCHSMTISRHTPRTHASPCPQLPKTLFHGILYQF